MSLRRTWSTDRNPSNTLPGRRGMMKTFLVWTLLPLAHAFFFASPSARTVPEKCKVLILPGFGNDVVDYTDEGQAGVEGSLSTSLKRRGWNENQIEILSVERSDWLKVFLRGATDLKFWQSNAAPTRPAFAWYLEKIAEKIQELDDDETIVLVAHSAGGWLARAALGFSSTDVKAPQIDLKKIVGLVTLGAPNLPPPPEFMDMTRGALRITNEEFPGAYHSPDIFYITVVGDAVVGQKQERKSPFERTSTQGLAYNTYEAVCGNGDVAGDGLVPVPSAHLDGASQLTLTGVLHSIGAPSNWYGSEKIIDQWHSLMLKQIERSRKMQTLKPFAKLLL